MFTIVSCATTVACTGGTNSSTGPGVQGRSAHGHGVVGDTTFNSTNNTNGESAVFGQDLSTSGVFDMGVQGVSIRGYGVRGKSASNVGVRGDSTSSVGVEGTSTNANAVVGNSTNSIGVVGQSASYVGVFGQGVSYGLYGSATTGYGAVGASSNLGVYGVGDNFGLYGITSAGKGIFADSGSGQAVFAQSNSGRPFEGHTNSGLGLYVTNGSGNGGDIAGSYIGVVGRSDTFPLVATNSGGSDLFWIDGNGNVNYTGSLVQHSRVGGSAATTSGTQPATPPVEETGTTRLTFGQANVYLSPSFAHSVNVNRGYQVFLTPGGETHGLYVANKYAGGFVVREMYGGRSNITFDYHVYASSGAPAAAAAPSLSAPHAGLVQPARVPAVAAPRAPTPERPEQ